MAKPDVRHLTQGNGEASGLEKRNTPRLPCSLETSYRELVTGRVGSRLGKVQNISRGGIGLLCERWIKPGSVLILTLRDANQKPFRPMVMRVLHATATEDGRWLVGGTFVRKLSAAEFRGLLESDPSCQNDEEAGEPAPGAPRDS
jgi:hypothetical protein